MLVCCVDSLIIDCPDEVVLDNDSLLQLAVQEPLSNGPRFRNPAHFTMRHLAIVARLCASSWALRQVLLV